MEFLKYIDFKGIFVTLVVIGGKIFIKKAKKYYELCEKIDRGIIPLKSELSLLDKQISSLSSSYINQTSFIIKDLVSYQGKFPNKPMSFIQSKLFKRISKIILHENVIFSSDNLTFDGLGNLVFFLTDPNDNIPINDRKVIFINNKIDLNYNQNDFPIGIDPITGLIDFNKCNIEQLRTINQLLPPFDSWEKITIGKGTCSGFQSVATTIMSFKILKETIELGSLKGSIIVSSISFQEHLTYHEFHNIKLYPDVIIISESSSSLLNGPSSIGLGQLGKCIINLDINDDNNNEKIFSKINKEILKINEKGFNSNPFLGSGSLFITDSSINSSIKFHRTLTLNENYFDALNEINSLSIIKKLKKNLQSIAITKLDDYSPWKTPIDDESILAITESYRRTISPWIDELKDDPFSLKKHLNFIPLLNNNNYNGYPLLNNIPNNKKWLKFNNFVSPPMFSLGTGYFEISGFPGEFIFNDHLQIPLSLISRFPSLFIKQFKKKK